MLSGSEEEVVEERGDEVIEPEPAREVVEAEEEETLTPKVNEVVTPSAMLFGFTYTISRTEELPPCK